MLGKDTAFYGVIQQADGMKVKVMCPSVTDVHRLVHSAYAHMACAQTTLTIYANNQVGPSTSFHGGSYGETTCVTDDQALLFAILKSGDIFVTDKGYYLKDLLSQRYDAVHLKPTEMAGGSGAGMTEEQCTASQNIAQIRSVTERVVLLFKRFDIFGGAPVHMNEWHLMDDYKNIVTMLVMKKGPLPDHLGTAKAPPTGPFNLNLAYYFAKSCGTTSHGAALGPPSALLAHCIPNPVFASWAPDLFCIPAQSGAPPLFSKSSTVLRSLPAFVAPDCAPGGRFLFSRFDFAKLVTFFAFAAPPSMPTAAATPPAAADLGDATRKILTLSRWRTTDWKCWQ
jgi:hypothetical protein